MNNTGFEQIREPIKIVIWDLDETFWNGTLSEEGITPIQENIRILRELADRGIVSSICSKNDFDAARQRLQDLGVWDLFVFPHIDWSPKGQAISAMLDRMGLRAVNALFLDDNHLNLEEVGFFNEGIACVDGRLDLAPLLDLPQLGGKDDREHSRLKQYKVMEGKLTEQRDSGLSNEDFLRQSGIQIRIITDIDDKMDRVLELLNRTNQLNFTKIRANTDDEKAALNQLLSVSGMHAGLIHVRDRYGDYGIVGFFCVRTKYSGNTAHHFAFSCRTLNMGVEQWVWAKLGRPEMKIVGPVASKLDSPETVDWISEVSDFDLGESQIADRRLCLVGGCDLLQVSFYCGRNRDEFVNREDDKGMLVRFDDPGFFTMPRDQELKFSKPLRDLVGWTLDDLKQLDSSLASADVILLSLYYGAVGQHYFSFGGKDFGGRYFATIPPRRMNALMRDPDTALRFAKEMYYRRPEYEHMVQRVHDAFVHAHELRDPQKPLFILGAATKTGAQAERTLEKRLIFNQMCRSFCDSHDNAHFIDLDTLLEIEDFGDSDHYTRTGYFKIADHINRTTEALLSDARQGSLQGA